MERETCSWLEGQRVDASIAIGYDENDFLLYERYHEIESVGESRPYLLILGRSAVVPNNP